MWNAEIHVDENQLMDCKGIIMKLEKSNTEEVKAHE